jgi:hypothetical protein
MRENKKQVYIKAMVTIRTEDEMPQPPKKDCDKSLAF